MGINKVETFIYISFEGIVNRKYEPTTLPGSSLPMLQ